MPANFNASAGNRRRPDRAAQLDRAKQIAIATLRAVAYLTGTAAAAVLVVLGVRAAYHYATTAEVFAVDAVEVAGDVGGSARLSGAPIRAVAELPLGTNLFRAPLGEVRHRLEQNPWIRSAQVERHLPRRVLISVEQRRPVAYVELSGLYLIDDRGQVFKRAAADNQLDLPTITGLSRQDFIAGKDALREQLSLALSFIAPPTGTRLPWDAGELSEVHFDEDLGIALELGSLPMAVELGFPPFDDKLERLRRARHELSLRQVQASALYLEDSRQPDHVGMALAGVAPVPNTSAP